MHASAISRRGLLMGFSAMVAPALVSVSTDASAATRTLSPGQRGPEVKALQQRLLALGYWCGAADGAFGANTAQAVVALQKVGALARDGIVGPRTQAVVSKGLRPRARRGGSRIEIDLARQVILIVRSGAVTSVLNTSTGNGAEFEYQGKRIRAVTPKGEFSIFRKGGDGWETGELGGLWRPFYFNGGIALHGAVSVPAQPASHGCCRVTVAAQNYLIANKLLFVGERVSVY